ncbi:MAG: CoA transferase [Gammaproteobacteria bacterium]|nr:CoA transferase [Gammaproteobacteria bacterium]
MIPLRVLQVGTDPSVAYCGLQFALWGADVAVFRVRGEAESDELTERYLSANKRLITRAAEAAGADILLTAQSTAALDRLGIEHEDAIVSRIVPYAENGVLDGTPSAPLLLEAASGYLGINGSPDQEPLRAPANLAAYIVGASAFGATLAAVHKRLATGEVEQVVTSGLDVLASMTPFLRSQLAGRADRRHGGPATGVRLFPVGDGKVSLNLADESTFTMALGVLGIDRAAVPTDLDTPAQRHDDPAALGEFLRSNSDGRSAVAFFKAMIELGAPRIGLFQEPGALLCNEHMRATGYFRTLDDPEHGETAYPGMPAAMSRIDPPPLEPMRNSGDGWQAADLMAGRHRSRRRPLEGLRIVDFTQAWIGPFATMMLADLGADVIKVESHRRPDIWRNSRPASRTLRNPNAHPFNTSANFASTNRNKRGIAVDLNDGRGRNVARELIRTADVVASNFTPRVMRKFGLDHASLASTKHDIITVTWSGYGETGPYADYKANGATIEAMAGWDALFGYADGDPMVMGFYQMDAITGLQMAACTLLGLVHRDLTGEGQEVAGSMIASAVPYVGEEVIRASLFGRNTRWGNRHPAMAPHGVYPVQGDDQWIALACRDDQEWQTLAGLIGMDDDALNSLAARRAAEDEIDARIADWSRCRPRETAIREAVAAGVPAAPVLDVLEILDYPEFAAREWFPEQHHPDLGTLRYGGFPWAFDRGELAAERPPPRLGEHTSEILAEIGLDASEVDALYRDDVVGTVLGS